MPWLASYAALETLETAEREGQSLLLYLIVLAKKYCQYCCPKHTQVF